MSAERIITLHADKREEFKALADAMIKFLNDNGNPHTTVIITATSAEIVQGVEVYYTEDHLCD